MCKLRRRQSLPGAAKEHRPADQHRRCTQHKPPARKQPIQRRVGGLRQPEVLREREDHAVHRQRRTQPQSQHQIVQRRVALFVGRPGAVAKLLGLVEKLRHRDLTRLAARKPAIHQIDATDGGIDLDRDSSLRTSPQIQLFQQPHARRTLQPLDIKTQRHQLGLAGLLLGLLKLLLKPQPLATLHRLSHR
jgi:hypothetical protein